MNKLEDAIAQITWASDDPQGALYKLTEDVACQFAEWKDRMIYSFELRRVGTYYQIDGNYKIINQNELFKYFINNIYKPTP